MRIRYAAKTDVGRKRSHNEDYFALLEEEQLFLVADGMGGHASGEVASRMAANAIIAFYKRTHDDPDATWPYKPNPEKSLVETRAEVAIKAANWTIFYEQSQNSKYKGMGTTVVLAQVIEGTKMLLAHVGDSRAYRYREGKLEQITVDHSLLEEYKRAKQDITEEEIANFPHKNVITRALGMKENVNVDTQILDMQSGDIYLLCSDGLSGMVPDPDMEKIISEHKDDLEATITKLIDQANENGGVDNITVVLVQAV